MAGFRDLSERLAELEGIPSRVAKEVASGIGALVADEFASGHDAYGRVWSPLLPSTVRRKHGDTRILRRTDKLSAETRVTPSQRSGVEIVSIYYGGVHQAGDPPRMVARPILPDGADLPKAWETLIQNATDRAFKKALK